MNYPSAKDKGVVYNVARSAFDPEGHYSASDVTYVSTIERPPAISGHEIRHVCRRTKNCIVDQLRDYELPAVNELHQEIFGRYSVVWDEWGDRTVLVSLRDLRAITPELVVSLQSYVLRKFPLWRIWICDDSDPEEGILVYSDAAVAGSVSRHEPLANAIEEWKSSASDRWERRYGPMRRQIAFVEGRLLDVLRTWTHGRRARVVCAFDNDDGDFTKHAVWCIQTFRPSQVVLVGEEEITYYQFAPVTKGRLGARSAVWQPLRMWAVVYVVPCDASHVFDMRDVNDSSWTYHVAVPVVADRELQSRGVK
jgi:hypothetical protein